MEPLLITYPLKEENLSTMIDISEMLEYKYHDNTGMQVDINEITKDHPDFDDIMHERSKFIELLSNYSEEIADHYLEGLPLNEIG